MNSGIRHKLRTGGLVVVGLLLGSPVDLALSQGEPTQTGSMINHEIRIVDHQAVTWDGEQVSLDQLATRMREAKASNSNNVIVIKADREADYQTVLAILKVCDRVGCAVGLASQRVVTP